MSVRQRRYIKEELARRGQELYDSAIRHQVEVGNEGKIVAIDIETGTFEVDDHVLPATNRLFEQYPDAQPWVIRIGHRAIYHFGARSLAKLIIRSGCASDPQQCTRRCARSSRRSK
jgi:hypothetical protein